MGKRRTRKRRQGYALRLPSGEINTPVKTWWMRQGEPQDAPETAAAPDEETTSKKEPTPKKQPAPRKRAASKRRAAAKKTAA